MGLHGRAGGSGGFGSNYKVVIIEVSCGGDGDGGMGFIIRIRTSNVRGRIRKAIVA